jgi:type II secretory pathway pseudopilin PulG
LIELLIVVAIIAILAAIAVPNFLEAQTRSKVSRAHSDMRTLATAFEAYTLDWNRVPLDYLEWAAVYGVPQWERYYCYRQLTTPVAYITSWLNDPFAKWARVTPGDTRPSREEMKYYHYENFVVDRAAGATIAGRPEAFGRGSLYSIGPTALESTPWIANMLGFGGPAALGNIYDPTNGTVSVGKIFRTNKGILTGADIPR